MLNYLLAYIGTINFTQKIVTNGKRIAIAISGNKFYFYCEPK